LAGKPNRKKKSQDQNIGGRMESEEILDNLAGRVWGGYTWEGEVVISCEHNDETSGSGTTQLVK
jgi:hypothetical protein